jgi:hypothetical protein
MKNACVTICSVNYISKALVLADSYLKFNNEDDFYLLLIDKKDSKLQVPKHITLFWIEDLGIENWQSYAFAYDVIEFNTNVKPFMLIKLLKKYQKVMYLDPDIEVFDSLVSVWNDLDEHAAVLTPHYVKPIIDGCKPDDVELLKFGAYNLGFVAVSNKTEALKFLHWWSDRCLELGYYEPQSGFGVDQKWVSLAPSFFQGIKISFDLGLNLAFWNLHEREIIEVNGRYKVNNEYDLKFIHFSSFDINNPESIAKKQDRFPRNSRLDFVELAVSYAKKLSAQESIHSMTTRYSFDYFDDGVYITPALRRFYFSKRNDKNYEEDAPFSVNSKIRKFGNKNRLVIKDYEPGQRLNFKNLNDASKFVKIIDLLLKVTLRLIGPLNYFNLMRYLAHISSIRNQKNVLK